MTDSNIDGSPFHDPAIEKDIVTNDAVAGETVLDGRGDGNTGPTGGSPSEAEPEYAENDLAGVEIDLDEND